MAHLLEVKDLVTTFRSDGKEFNAIEGVSLHVDRGEIVGITGLQGSGASEFLQSIFGELPTFSGTVKVSGEAFTHNNIHHAMKKGIALLPANRKENSVVPDMSILENMYLLIGSLGNGFPDSPVRPVQL